jgi:hypothetical protein
MPWKIEYDHDLKNIEIHYEGTLTPDELLAAVHATIALAKERQTRLILTNLTKMEGGLSIVDLYDLADLLVALNLGHFKEAVLYSRFRQQAGRSLLGDCLHQPRPCCPRLYR